MNILKIKTTKIFKKHYKLRVSKKDDVTFQNLLKKLLAQETLEAKYKDHKLQGKLKDFRECHIKNDLLLLYKIVNDSLILVDIGSHNQLFE